VPLYKPVHLRNFCHGRWQTAARCCRCDIGCIKHRYFTTEVDNSLTAIENCSAKCGLPFGHVISNDDALTFTEDEENDWCHL
jgi:hypothetical protein